jgi:hypothetical protein
MAFVDVDLTDLPPIWPELPLYRRACELIYQSFEKAGVERRMGMKMHSFFAQAGLPPCQVRIESFVSAGMDSPTYEWVSETLRTLMPVAERFGLATAAEIDIDTLADRLRAEAVAAGATVVSPCIVGGWTRVP